MGATMGYLAERGIFIERASISGIPDVASARNKTIEHFLQRPDSKKFTHFMWIDDDMVWSPDCIEKLLSYDVPIASALVTLKSPPFRVTLFEIAKNKEGHLDTFDIPLGSYPLDKSFTYANSVIGTAFMLMKREVIDRMKQPYFTDFTNDKGVRKGTDIYFGMMAIKLGYEFLYDPTLRVYHVGKGLYGLEDYIAYRELEKEGKELSCLFSATSATDVERFKMSLCGPQKSLIQSHVSVVNKQLEESAPPVKSYPV